VDGDDRHIYSRLESFNSGGTLLNSGESYDYTVQQYTKNTVGVYATPTVTVFTPSATGVKYNIGILPLTVTLDNAWPFDYFIVEFPRPDYNDEPHVISSNLGTVQVSQGNNWLMWKPSSPLAAGNSLLVQFSDVTNPV